MKALLDKNLEASFRSRSRVHASTRVAVCALVASAMAGCSGGTGDSGSGAPGRGTVVVTVQNTVGEPVREARVEILGSSTSGSRLLRFGGSVTDVSGRAVFRDVPAGFVLAGAQHAAFNGGSSGDPAALSRGATLNLAVQLEPLSLRTAGVTGAGASAADVTEDGRVLEFTLDIVDFPSPPEPDWEELASVEIVPCEPRSASDLSDSPADCIAGDAAFDAPYAGEGSSRAVAFQRQWSSGPDQRTTSTVALLLDQSANFVGRDPDDARLFAAKHFVVGASDLNPVLLGAFASDRPAAGEISALPTLPLTLFPLEDPRPTGQGRSLFDAINGLASVEGGATAMLTATDRLLDVFDGANWPTPRDVIMVTDGGDAQCGSRAECRAALDRVVMKARAAGIRIATVGVSGVGGDVDAEFMSRLGQETGGGAFWLDNPGGLAVLLAQVRGRFASGSPPVHARFRIRSPDAGAFAPGRIVTGKVQLVFCPWDCETVTVPFAVRIT